MEEVAHKIKGGRRDLLSIRIQISFEFEWPTNLILIHSKWCTKKGCGMASTWEKIHEKLFLMNSNGCDEVRWRRERIQKWFQPN